MTLQEKALQMHYEWQGKVETKVKAAVETPEQLSLAYTPGVAEACLAIKRDPELVYRLTGKANTVAVVTDGTAILGLGNIGPEAGMPVMEGKCALFKTFGGVDAVTLCLDTQDTEEIIKTVKTVACSFGGINLEDISAPRCFEVERRLKAELGIPVFHDDQHGTAIVVGGALLNALKVVGKKIEDIDVVINGAGAAGIAIGKYLLGMGVHDVVMCDVDGILTADETYANPAHNEVAKLTNKSRRAGKLADAMKGADLFVGVSVGGVVSKDMVASMNDDAIVFTLANPVPEIAPELALEAGAAVVGTGSSRYPNQINNVLVFPGLFRGALDVRARDVNLEMMMAASRGIADTVRPEDLSAQCVLPLATDRRAHEAVASAVREAAVRTGVARVVPEE